MEWLKEILPYIGTLLGGGLLTHLINRKANKSKAFAESDSAQAAAAAKRIENEKSVIEIYRKLIEDIQTQMEKRVKAVEEEVAQLKTRLEKVSKEKDSIEEENNMLKAILQMAESCENESCPVIEEKKKWLQ